MVLVSVQLSYMSETHKCILYSLEWRDLCLLYGKMMDEPDAIRNTLKSYCMFLP